MDLYAIIHGNATLKSLATQGNDQAIADALNAPSVIVHRRVSREQLLRWAAKTGAIVKVEGAKTSDNPIVRALATAGLSILTSDVSIITLDDEFHAFLAQLVAATVLTQDDVDKLKERAAESISVAELQLGRPVSVDEVSRSLLVDRPNGIVGG